MSPDEFVRVAAVADLKDGRGKCVMMDDLKIALWRRGGTYYAFGDTCPHMGAPLSQGFLQGSTIVCHWHNWRFDASTGACLREGKSWAKIPVYDVRVEGGDILLRRPRAEPDPEPEDEPWMSWTPPDSSAEPDR